MAFLQITFSTYGLGQFHYHSARSAFYLFCIYTKPIKDGMSFGVYTLFQYYDTYMCANDDMLIYKYAKQFRVLYHVYVCFFNVCPFREGS